MNSRWNDRSAGVVEFIASREDEFSDGLNATLRHDGRDLILLFDDADEYRITVRREPSRDQCLCEFAIEQKPGEPIVHDKRCPKSTEQS